MLIIPNKKSHIYQVKKMNCSFQRGRNVGPAGFEPATQRIQAQLQFGICFIIINSAAVNLAV